MVLPIEIVEEIFNITSPEYYWKFLCLSKEHFKHFDTFDLYYNTFEYCELQVPRFFKKDIYDYVEQITKYEDIKRFFKKYFMIRKNHDPKDAKAPKNCYKLSKEISYFDEPYDELLYFDKHGKGIQTNDIELGDVHPYYVDETHKDMDIKYKIKIRHKITEYGQDLDMYDVTGYDVYIKHEEYRLYTGDYYNNLHDNIKKLNKLDTIEVTYRYSWYDGYEMGISYLCLDLG